MDTLTVIEWGLSPAIHSLLRAKLDQSSYRQEAHPWLVEAVIPDTLIDGWKREFRDVYKREGLSGLHTLQEEMLEYQVELADVLNKFQCEHPDGSTERLRLLDGYIVRLRIEQDRIEEKSEQLHEYAAWKKGVELELRSAMGAPLLTDQDLLETLEVVLELTQECESQKRNGSWMGREIHERIPHLSEDPRDRVYTVVRRVKQRFDLHIEPHRTLRPRYFIENEAELRRGLEFLKQGMSN